MSRMDLRKIQDTRIECARNLHAWITTDPVKSDVVDVYRLANASCRAWVA